MSSTMSFKIVSHSGYIPVATLSVKKDTTSQN